MGYGMQHNVEHVLSLVEVVTPHPEELFVLSLGLARCVVFVWHLDSLSHCTSTGIKDVIGNSHFINHLTVTIAHKTAIS